MKYKREEPDQGKRGKTLTDEQKLEAANAKGTTYQVGKHDGSSIYHTEKWLIDPLKQVTYNLVDMFQTGNFNLEVDVFCLFT